MATSPWVHKWVIPPSRNLTQYLMRWGRREAAEGGSVLLCAVAVLLSERVPGAPACPASWTQSRLTAAWHPGGVTSDGNTEVSTNMAITSRQRCVSQTLRYCYCCSFPVSAEVLLKVSENAVSGRNESRLYNTWRAAPVWGSVHLKSDEVIRLIDNR